MNWNEVLDYDKSTGILTWKRRMASHVPAGKTAGVIDDRGYVVIRYRGKQYTAHRIIMEMITGVTLARTTQVDHIDGNRSNNKLNNLRLATRSENNCNTGITKANKTGIKGISVDTRKCKTVYRAGVQLNGVVKDKRFPYTPAGKQAAVEWLVKAREDLHKEFSNHGTHLKDLI